MNTWFRTRVAFSFSLTFAFSDLMEVNFPVTAVSRSGRAGVLQKGFTFAGKPQRAPPTRASLLPGGAGAHHLVMNETVESSALRSAGLHSQNSLRQAATPQHFGESRVRPQRVR